MFFFSFSFFLKIIRIWIIQKSYKIATS